MAKLAHDVLIAFSCKARGLCPSRAGPCGARAAHDAHFLTEVIRVFARALGDRHRTWARSIAIDASEWCSSAS